MDRPFCEHTRSVLIRAAEKLQLRYHEKGTAVTIEGPRFSSIAESNMFRSWSCDVVNMTTVPEVCLAKEAGICYASIALSTDYDCWKDEPVSARVHAYTVIWVIIQLHFHKCRALAKSLRTARCFKSCSFSRCCTALMRPK